MKPMTSLPWIAAVLSIVISTTGRAMDVAPPASISRMVYDVSRQEAVLYGILLPGNVGLTQTWIWDGRWALAPAPSSPPGLKVPSMAYDEHNQRTVLFGGAIAPFTNTWVNNGATILWDGTNWSQASPMAHPAARFDCISTYDPLHTNIVLFGGDLHTNNAATPVHTNDTWVWDGANWAFKNPPSRPSARSSCGLAFDGARGNIVLFGGLTNSGGGGDFNDTWVWDGANWDLRTPASSPPSLASAAMSYDAVRREIVLFGGSTHSGPANGTWTWNGTNWSLKTPALAPPGRAGHSMVFDPVRGKTLLFGGDNEKTGQYADTWLWDGTNWQSSDLTLFLTAPPGTVFFGSNLNYSIVVTNGGPSLAEEVKLFDELPPLFAFVSAVSSQGNCSYANGLLTCDLGSLATGTNITVSVVVQPLGMGAATNVLTAVCSAELYPSNNVATAALTVVSPPLINMPLTNQTASANGQIVLGVSVTGSLPLQYQWFFNGTNLVSESSSSLTLTNLDWSQAGYYTVVISNQYGSVTNTAILSLDDLHMYAGIRIAGVPGAPYEIDARDNFDPGTPWLTLTNFTLPYSPYLFIDEASPNYPQRFYRVISQ